MLYIPGNNPAMIQQGGIYGADSILLDLEDAVAMGQKDSARILVRNMIKTIDFYDTEVCVQGKPSEYSLWTEGPRGDCPVAAFRHPLS